MFTLRTLFLLVSIVAIGTAAVIYRTPIVAAIVFSLAVLVLAVFALRAWSRPTQRSYWLPAAFFGWGYFVCAFVQPVSVRPHLVTSRLIFEGWFKYVYSEEHEAFTHEAFKERMYNELISKGNEVWVSSGPTTTVYELWRIYAMLQALISVAAGVIGGAIYSFSMRTDRHAATNTEYEVPGTEHGIQGSGMKHKDQTPSNHE